MLRYIWRTEGRDSKPDYELTTEQAVQLGDLQWSIGADRAGGDDEEGEVGTGGGRVA